MNYKVILVAAWLLIIMAAPHGMAQEKTTAATGTLTVLLDGFPSNDGAVRISLCNSSATCKSEKAAFRSAVLPVRDKKASWTVPGLPLGEYAIKAYHDENGNGKLDKNAFGLPKEAYGFSNNARGTFGPPSYENMAFRLDSSFLTVRITLK